jgi:transposase
MPARAPHVTEKGYRWLKQYSVGGLAELLKIGQSTGRPRVITRTVIAGIADNLQQFEIKPVTKVINFKDLKKGDYLEMAAYSIDLRQKILSAWQNKEGTQRELAKRFKVSLSFIRDFLRRYRETNEIAARTLLRGSPLEA